MERSMMLKLPREVAQLAERGRQALDHALALAPRAVALLDQAEALMKRVDALAAGIEEIDRQARALITKAQATTTAADRLVRQATALNGQLTPLVTAAEPALTKLVPIASRLANAVTPDDAAAAAQLINDLPEIVGKLNRDILPVLDTLGTLAPDLRDLLDVSKDVSELLGAVPGLGRVKRRIEDEQDNGESAREYTAEEAPPASPDRAPRP
jgi:ABC-type transporter Mla subunit MlaD